ncbi:MAG: sulfite exporter TauE/SafE family protein [Verrucomicrobia bacterium]|nr:MAG: sulfite exporter TauE/SafE family protein [Verrucomicrobiota bacterium]
MSADLGSLALAMFAALCVGVSKAGFGGLSMISVVVFAEIYGARLSTGLALPLLIAADLTVYPAFRRCGSWRPVWPLLLPTAVGLLGGWFLLGKIDDVLARRIIGGVVLAMVAVQLGRRQWPQAYQEMADSRGFGLAAGVAGGFATMLANAAGPIIQLFLLSRRFGKMDLVGVGARFFLLVNLAKVPLSAKLALISPASLLENAKLLPAMWLGVWLGGKLLRRVPQRLFEWLVVIFAILAGLRLTLA